MGLANSNVLSLGVWVMLNSQQLRLGFLKEVLGVDPERGGNKRG